MLGMVSEGIITEEVRQGVSLLTAGPAARLTDVIAYAVSRQEEWKERDICWLLDRFDFSNFATPEVHTIVAAMRTKITRDHGRKTACVVAHDLGFGMLRMLECLLPEDVPVRFRVFRTREEALAWLHSADS